MATRTAGGNAAFHNFHNDYAHIADPNERRRLALAEIDKAPFGWYHIRAIIVAGIGFFTVSLHARYRSQHRSKGVSILGKQNANGLSRMHTISLPLVSLRTCLVSYTGWELTTPDQSHNRSRLQSRSLRLVAPLLAKLDLDGLLMWSVRKRWRKQLDRQADDHTDLCPLCNTGRVSWSSESSLFDMDSRIG